MRSIQLVNPGMFQHVTRHTDIFLAAGVLCILFIMLLPMPPMVMDMLLVLNITFGILILLMSLYVLKPMDFSSFPSILLLSTLFRLGLNVATTRLILLHGAEGQSAAGHVIEGFGQFVVGGNTVVGLVIFLILVLINFIVITKGSTRIAEVAARFTLDSMPGKQMAIDADLNAGLIDETTARQRRDDIAREADFYGAMDGSAKFVRGDAVAGLIITAINLFGGLIIGTAQMGMPFSDAVTTFSILTIGDGLVAQIPALVISTAAGIVITRAGGTEALPSSLAFQFGQNPRLYMVATGALLIMALIPGLPFVPFILMAIGMGLAAWYLSGEQQEEDIAVEEGATEEAQEQPINVGDWMSVDPIRLEVGYGLIDLVESGVDGGLLQRVQAIRRQIAREVGFVLPPLHIKDNLRLNVNEYRLLIRGAEVARSSARPNLHLAIESSSVHMPVEGETTMEPAFGLPAVWISGEKKVLAEQYGYTVVDPSTMIVTHLSEVLRQHAHEIIDRSHIQELLDQLSEQYPKVVETIVPNVVSPALFEKVLQHLLREWVPIRDLLLILETIADLVEQNATVEVIVEKVRQRIGRSIVQPYLNEQRELEVFTLEPSLENMMVENKTQNPDIQMPLSTEYWQRFLDQFSKVVSAHSVEVPVLLTVPLLRGFLARELRRYLSRVAVLSIDEIPSNINIRAVGSIGTSDAG